jgi:hypothetical protein
MCRLLDQRPQEICVQMSTPTVAVQRPLTGHLLGRGFRGRAAAGQFELWVTPLPDG